ncbi:hypothetical protein [Desulfosporosinus sp.]|uniref:hypothetical protein n=1 Tax=Desulfosporosinus sp. TaxID=157907 RepID=UPI0025C40662|nr:hypothetical protein [Desulfosporosinus sp.]MBC2722043.1 hypothetical protein [Desulfosporosinus sp.]MBC2728026.1 hypothetical protein [Desulfosporosinus sp.]
MFFYIYALKHNDGTFQYPFGMGFIQNPKYVGNDMAFKSEESLPDTEGLVAITEFEYDEFDRVDNPQPLVKHPTEIDLLGQQLVEKELQILELQQENQILGQQLVDIDLRLLMGGL